MNKFISINNRGQSLVELLIAIGLAAILIPAIFAGIGVSREGRAQHDQRVEAVSKLKSAQEAVRSIAERNWTWIPSNGTYHPVISGNSWILSAGPIIENGFTTTIVIDDVYRDGSGSIVSSGGDIDLSTKKVITTVSWNTPLIAQVSATSYFSRYKNSAYTETTASQFNAGVLTNVQVTNVSGGEIKLINNNKAKWCSPAFSSATIDLPDGPPVAVAATASASSINSPNDAYVAVSPLASNSIKLAHVNITANTDPPVTTQRGKFTLNASEYSNPSYVPTGLGLDNNFKTTDVKYFKSSGGNTYALLGTDLPSKEVIAVWVNDGNDSNDNNTSGEFQDPVNKIYKYKTFFNTKIYGSAFNNPTANSAETSSAGDNNGYESNPTRAYLNDGSFAVDYNSGSNTGTNCTGNDKDKHRFYNYGFSIPTGATIDGIEMNIVARADSTTGSPKICVQLSWDGGSTWTSAKSTNNLTTSSEVYSLGGSADTWGRTWSDANFSDANFRVRVIDVASSTSRDFSLDWVGVKVHYNGISTIPNDLAPYNYGASSITTIGNVGYVASAGYLYVFDLSNIDGKTSNSGLDQLGCRIQLDGYDCKANEGGKKYSSGQTGSAWGDTAGSIHPDCSDGGNIELNATNDTFPVKVGNNTYIYTAVGGITNPEFEIVNVTNVPDGSSSPSISNPSCGRISGGNSGWKVISTYDFNSNSNTEEAANSVFANSAGTRAYISSNGGIDGDDNGQPDSKQFYILNTSDKNNPSFLSGSPSTGPTSGFYYGTGANAELYPRRSLTVLNGERVVLVGRDGISNGNDAQEYQVLNSETEASPTYCAGLNFDQGFNDLTSVTEADSDNYVYMVANTTLNELKIIEGGPDDAIYVSSGIFESQTFDATNEYMFNRFFSTSTIPAQTTLIYQVAIAHPISGSCSGVSYNFVGPDGTINTFFNSPSELPRSSDGSGYENAGQCMRYKVYMSSLNQQQTPIMYDFGVNYSF